MSLKSAAHEVFKILTYYLYTLLLPMFVALLFQEYQVAMVFSLVFVLGMVVCRGFSWLFSGYTCSKQAAFLVLLGSWIGVVLLSLIPWYAIFPIAIDVAIFESVSALTTTGVDLIGLDQSWPASMLFFRQQLTWVGGVGVVVLAVSLLSLYDQSIYSHYLTDYGLDLRQLGFAQRVSKLAQRMLLVYFILTALCVLSFVVAGLGWWHALLESFAIVSTGGFSLKPVIPTLYESSGQQWVAIVFMLAGSTGLLLYEFLIRRMWHRLARTEVQYLFYMLMVGVVYISVLQPSQSMGSVMFMVVSSMSTTGLVPVSNILPDGAFVLMLIYGIIGGSVGSTAGGLKLYRFHVVLQGIYLLLNTAREPDQVATVFVDGRAYGVKHINQIFSYVGLFFATALAGIILLSLSGTGLAESGLMVLSMITNVGAFIPQNSFFGLSVFQNLVLALIMLLGRVELVAVCVLFLPQYWKRITRG